MAHKKSLLTTSTVQLISSFGVYFVKFGDLAAFFDKCRQHL